MADLKQKEVMYIKGAPDVLLDKCSHYLDASGNHKPLDAAFHLAYKTAYEAFGGNGERVLAFAMSVLKSSIADEEKKDPKYKQKKTKELALKDKDAVKEFCFLGLISLIDPPRPEVPSAISDCHNAGIKVVMVTGDHPITAAAIARNIGLITHPTREDIAKQNGVPVEKVNESEVGAVVIHGHQINDMTDDDWRVVISKPDIVFARTSPEQKLIIVKKFTSAGYLTAMTGDGVNDSPALKQAAIGIAMGKNGSDVAREAADIILLDDNFASIVVGIREGRLLFSNLKKSIAYTLAHTMPEVTDALAFILLAYPLPTTAILLLCIDLLTELLPAMSLAYENPENNIMQMKPRLVAEDRLISFPLLGYSYFQAGAMISIACFTSYFLAFWSFGITIAEVASFGTTYFSVYPTENYISLSGVLFTPDMQLEVLYSAIIIMNPNLCVILLCCLSH
jgi:sodium/potassium-transporting ATPase subunit alpha